MGTVVFANTRDKLLYLLNLPSFGENTLEKRWRKQLNEAVEALELFLDTSRSSNERLDYAGRVYRAFEAAQGSFRQWKRSVQWEHLVTQGEFYVIDKTLLNIRKDLTSGVAELRQMVEKGKVRYLVPASFISETSPPLHKQKEETQNVEQ